MSCFWDTQIAIAVWRFLSGLQNSNIADSVEERMRANIKDEYLNPKGEEEMFE